MDQNRDLVGFFGNYSKRRETVSPQGFLEVTVSLLQRAVLYNLISLLHGCVCE